MTTPRIKITLRAGSEAVEVTAPPPDLSDNKITPRTIHHTSGGQTLIHEYGTKRYERAIDVVGMSAEDRDLFDGFHDRNAIDDLLYEDERNQAWVCRFIGDPVYRKIGPDMYDCSFSLEFDRLVR